MYSTQTAYLLWIASFFGIAGVHRFYLGKIGTGLLWLCTGGLLGVGTLYDAVTMTKQVREANLRLRVRDLVEDEFGGDSELEHRQDSEFMGSSIERPRSESPEHVILRVAKANHGLASPANVALEGNVSTDAAREQLDSLVDKGIGEVRVRKTGTLVYAFPDFLDEEGSADLEQY